jgi:hypothetical protein
MAISRSNFRYAGSWIGSTGTTDAAQRWAALASQHQGAGWANNNEGGGEAAFGSVVPHSFLSGTAPASAGDFCLGYMYGQASHPSNNSYHRAHLVAAFVTTGSDSGSDFPVDTVPNEGTRTAYSIRAFLRLGNDNSSINANHERNQGSEIGIFVKGIGPGTNQQNDYTASPTGSLSASYYHDADEDATDPFYASGGSYNPRMSGYYLSLSTLRDDSDGTTGGTSEAGVKGARIPRLKFHAHRTNNINHSVLPGVNSKHVEIFSGSFNTWYHVRMDVTPISGHDKVEIYTAPIANALGSETWTKRETVRIYATDEYYRSWDSTDSTSKQQDCGFFAAHCKTHDDDYLAHDALIDGFEFFTKDLT